MSFGEVDVGVEKQLSFTLRNFSAVSRRFAWPNVEGVSFRPSAGHLLPHSAKSITATFCSDHPLTLGMEVEVELTPIRQEGEGGAAGAGVEWDDTMMEVKYLTQAELEERARQRAAAAAAAARAKALEEAEAAAALAASEGKGKGKGKGQPNPLPPQPEAPLVEEEEASPVEEPLSVVVPHPGARTKVGSGGGQSGEEWTTGFSVVGSWWKWSAESFSQSWLGQLC